MSSIQHCNNIIIIIFNITINNCYYNGYNLTIIIMIIIISLLSLFMRLDLAEMLYVLY